MGGTDKERRDAGEQIEQWFEDKPTRVKPFEVPRTDKERKIIEAVEESVDRSVRQYGGAATGPASNERIFLVRPGTVKQLTGSKLEDGLCSYLGQYIVAERNPSDLQFALTLAHELFHFKSFKAARISQSGPDDVRLYRSGLTMVDRKDDTKERGEEVRYFNELEEAIVTEATQRVYNADLRISPIFRKEVESIDRIKHYLRASFREPERSDAMRIVRNVASQTEWGGVLAEIRSLPPQTLSETLGILESKSYDEHERFARVLMNVLRPFAEKETSFVERHKERKRFSELLDQILWGLPGKFKSKEEVFDEFARANFTGNYLPIARIIEQALGRGSFRRLAREFSRPDSR